MRNDDLIEPGVIEILVMAAFDERAVVSPFAVDRQDQASRSAAFGLVCVFGESVRCESCAGDESAGLMQERASIHFDFAPDIKQNDCEI